MYDPTKPYIGAVERIICSTWRTEHEPSSVDGIGSKGLYHWIKRTFHAAVLDALAMNLNDILVLRGCARKLWCHMILPEDDHEAILAIVRALADECLKRGIEYYGGETSMQEGNIRGLEIGLTVVDDPAHIVKEQNYFVPGDVVVGLASSGLHSNGFSKVRELFGEDDVRPEFVEPTRIYYDAMLPLLEKYNIHGMAHITGGGFTKILNVLRKQKQQYPHTFAVIHGMHALEPQPIFHELFQRGVPDYKMYQTFNCGIGFVISLPKREANAFVREFPPGEAAAIGFVLKGVPTSSVDIKSKFTNNWLVYQ